MCVCDENPSQMVRDLVGCISQNVLDLSLVLAKSLLQPQGAKTTFQKAVKVEGEYERGYNAAQKEYAGRIAWAREHITAVEAETLRLRVVLERIACRHVNENPLWWQVEARTALAPEQDFIAANRTEST